jgi:hypothetical protein
MIKKKLVFPIILLIGLGLFTTSTYAISNCVYAHYTLNETSGTNAYDSSGNNRNGTTINTPLWVSGKLNNSINLNGVNQYIDLGNIASFEYNQSFSVESWVNLTATGNRAIVTKSDGSINKGWRFEFSNQKVIMVLANPSGQITIHTNDIIPLNNWYHIIMTYNGSGKASGIKIYVNGTEMFLVTDIDNLANKTIINDRKCMIGVLDGSTSKYYYFSGRIDEVLIYNKTLNQTEVNLRYNGGIGTEQEICLLPPPPTTTTTITPTTTSTTTTIIPPIPSPISVTRCIDNTTLEKIIGYSFQVMHGNPVNFSYSKNTLCDYGCDTVTNTCSPNTFNLVGYLIIGLFVMLIVIGSIIKIWRR